MSDVLDMVLVAPQAPARQRWFELDASRLALVFDPSTPFEAWQEATTRLLEAARGVQWWLGDALAFGEDAYGEDASALFDPERYSFESIDRMARVARAIPPSRRRPTVGFYQHMAVTGLPAPIQDALLDFAAEHHTTVADMRVLVRSESRRLERERAAALPAPQLLLDGIRIEVGDATALPLAPDSVDVLVTSPPYGLDSATVAKYRVADESTAWVRLMLAFLAEAYRVLAPQGRLLVNVPIDTTTGGHRPVYAQLVAAAVEAGFHYRSTIRWADGHLGRSTARGSVDSAGAVNVIAPCETVLVAHKGEWKRPARTNDIGHEEWVSWCNGDWALPGEGRPWEGFEAAYPASLPRRLLKLFSFREDVVLDPFLGSGTTAVVAYELGRTCLGFDIDPLQVASATRRLAVVARRSHGRAADDRDRGTV